MRNSKKDIYWPPKTININKLKCKIKVKSFLKCFTYNFHFIDWPGEVFNNFKYNKNDDQYNHFFEMLNKSICIVITVDPTRYFFDSNYKNESMIYFELLKDLKDKSYLNKNIAIVFTKKDDFESTFKLDSLIEGFYKDAEIKNLISQFNCVNFFYLNSFNGKFSSNSSVKAPPSDWDTTSESPEITSLVKYLASIIDN